MIHIDEFELTVLTACHTLIESKTQTMRSDLRFSCGHHGEFCNALWRGRIEMVKFPDRASKHIDQELYDGLDMGIYDFDEVNLNSKFDFALCKVKVFKNQADMFENWK